MSNNRLTEILRNGRDSFNAQFEEARKRYPKLDSSEFLRFFSLIANLAVPPIEKNAPERVMLVVQALYQSSLDLMGQEIIGGRSRYPCVNQAWQELLPLYWSALAESPILTLKTITNGVYSLSKIAGARPLEWISLLCALSKYSTSVVSLQKLGQIAAWKSGLAHYRHGVLTLLQELPIAAQLDFFKLNDGHTQQLPMLIQGLLRDPWYVLEAEISENGAVSKKKNLSIVKRVGGFRGFGGDFLVPPLVASHPQGFMVKSDDKLHLLTVDLFGATFHRINDQNFVFDTALVKSDGTISFCGHTQRFDELHSCTSAAANETTIALTTAHSHSIYLVAMTYAHKH